MSDPLPLTSQNRRPYNPGPAARSLLLAALLLGIFPTAWWIRDFVVRDDAPVVCTFRLLTGRPCPFCGLTRAICEATHARFTAATRYHPLWWLAATGIFLCAALLLLDAATGRAATRAALGALGRRWRWLVALAVVFGVWRLL